MAENSKIEWCHHTFNPWRGCTKVSPGCTHCYADTLSKRNPLTLGVWGPKGTRVLAAVGQWREPVKWNKRLEGTGRRERVFCASLADVFEDWKGSVVDAEGDEIYWCERCQYAATRPVIVAQYSPAETTQGCPECGRERRAYTLHDVRCRLFRLIAETPNLDWLLLTKRPANITKLWPGTAPDYYPDGWPNVWLGTSVEDQKRADERIPHLLRTPAAVRFLSCEPLLDEVDVRPWLYSEDDRAKMDNIYLETLEGNDTTKVHWVIVGGESGPGARTLNVDWVRDLVGQCEDAGTPCFVKQLGAKVVDECEECTPDYTGWAASGEKIDWETGRVTLADRKGGDPSEWPAELRVREFPDLVRGSGS